MAFVVVKYGANEEKLVNPNCLCAVLLNHVKKSCGFSEILENVDLASESGEVMDLVSKPREYARKFLEPRSSYILVKVMGDEIDESSPIYVPLLDQTGDKIKFSVTNPTFRLRSKGRAGAKGEPPKVDKAEDAIPSQAARPSKATQQFKPGKSGDKALDSKAGVSAAAGSGVDKLGAALGSSGASGAEELNGPRRSVAGPPGQPGANSNSDRRVTQGAATGKGASNVSAAVAATAVVNAAASSGGAGAQTAASKKAAR